MLPPNFILEKGTLENVHTDIFCKKVLKPVSHMAFVVFEV